MKIKFARWKRELPLFLAMAALILFVVVYLTFVGELTSKEIGAGFLSLFGTFIGAFLAFRLQQIKEADATETARVDAINRTLTVLIFQYNHLATWKRTLDQYTGKLERMVNLPPERDLEQFDLRQNVESLAFFVDVGLGNLIMSIAIEQSRFDAARMALNERCRVLVDEIQPVLEARNLNNRPLEEGLFLAVLGERRFGMLETATDQVYLHVPMTVDSLMGLIDELHLEAKKLYPHRVILKMIPA